MWNITSEGRKRDMKICIVKQHDIKDCGVACLASIIKYYDGYVPIEKLRLDTHTSESGTSALNLITCARKYGFDSSGIKCSKLNSDIKLPAIAHVTLKNGLDHFVVIYKFTKSNITLMDPAKGKAVMKLNDFLAIWNKVLLLFYPKQKIIFMPKENSLRSIFIKILFNEKKLFISILVYSILLTIFTICSSYYFKFVIDAISENKDFTYIKVLFVAFGFILTIKLVLNSIRKKLENHLNKNIDCLLLADFLNHLFNLPLEVISSRKSGEILTRVHELMNIKSLFTEIFVSCFLDLLLTVASAPILYKINSTLFFVLLFIVCIYLTIGLLSSKSIYKRAYQNIELEADFNSLLVEDISLINSIKNLNLTNSILKNIEYKLAPFLLDSFKLNKFVNFISNIKFNINEIGLFVVNTIGFYLIYKNELTISSLITFNTIFVYFLDPLKNVIDVLPKYNYLKASFSKINEFLNIKKELLKEALQFNNFSIKLKNVTYSYNNYNNILKNANIEIKENEHVMLKGTSGCGKSTICKILMNYIKDYEGDILIGGINIKDYNLATIRENITYVSQKEKIISGSIKDNILYNREVDIEKYNKICEICFIEDIVAKKPMRYETIISNDSTFISGGEAQRIILARALLKESKIYLIDEALSEVDYQLERKIIKNIKKYFKDKTIIYITHKKQDDLFARIIDMEKLNGL